MAKFDFTEYENRSSINKGEDKRTKVGYFNSLKNDGDEAVVRFFYTSPAQFELVSVHNIKLGDKWRRISCLRESAYAPITDCPLCEAGEKVTLKFFVKLLEYVRDENGNIVAIPKVWERPMSFATTLKSYFDEYGDISQHVFKIKRHGVANDINTTYDIIYANPNIYKPEIYVPDFAGLDKLDLSRHSYMVKSRDEMLSYLDNGIFPNCDETGIPTKDADATSTYVKPTLSDERPVSNTQATISASGDVEPLQRQRRTFDYNLR